MQRIRIGSLIGVGIAIGLFVVACGGSSGQNAQAEAEWTWLTETKQELDGKRAQLADLRQKAMDAQVAEAVAEDMEAEEVEGEIEEIEEDFGSQITDFEEEIAGQTDEFTVRLVAFLNSDPMTEGEEPTERQVAALGLKSSEDIILAQEWIEKGGDYKRAIEIYETALMFDSGNSELTQALAQAQADRWMNEERFAVVATGMSEAEVRMHLGQANLHNVREYEDKGVIAWFYPTAEGGSAAAVWFQLDDDGLMTVYQVKFQAVDPKKLAEAAAAEEG